MKLDLQVRKATYRDIPLLTQMNKRLIEDEKSPNTMDDEQLQRRMVSFIDGRYKGWILEAGSEPAGYALTIDQNTELYVRHFFVDRPYRRRGYGRWLINWLDQNLFVHYQKITVDVLSHNPDAIAFWRAVGFVDHHIHLEMKVE